MNTVLLYCKNAGNQKFWLANLMAILQERLNEISIACLIVFKTEAGVYKL